MATKKRTTLPAGITPRKDGSLIIRTTVQCPETKKRKEGMRVLPPNTPLSEALRTLEEVREGLREALEEAARASPLPKPAPPTPTPESITYADYAVAWMARSRMRKASAEARMCGLAHRILPYLGEVPLSEINRSHVIGLRSHLELVGKDRRQNTVSTWWQFAMQILRDALADYDLRDCTQRLQGPRVSAKPPKRTLEVLSAAQVQRLCELAEERLPRWGMVPLIAYTGMRRGEALGLRWCDVDMQKGVIHIRRSAVQLKSGVWQIASPKSGKARMVGAPPVLVEALKRWREKYPGVGDALVLPGAEGKPLYLDAVLDTFRALSEWMGLGHTISPQVLRRSYVSISVSAGLDDALRRAMVGHSSPDLTDHYHQLRPEVAASVATAMWESHTAKVGSKT